MIFAASHKNPLVSGVGLLCMAVQTSRRQSGGSCRSYKKYIIGFCETMRNSRYRGERSGTRSSLFAEKNSFDVKLRPKSVPPISKPVGTRGELGQQKQFFFTTSQFITDSYKMLQRYL